jgi:ArsR family transcriptional regulator
MYNISVNAHIDGGYEMRDLVKAMKALSDETRLRILNLLLERECCVCEVMQALDISQTRASRNLSALYDAGFLKLRKDGLWSLYSIDNEEMKPHFADLVEAVRKGLDGNGLVAEDRKRLKKAKRVGPGCVRKCAK